MHKLSDSKLQKLRAKNYLAEDGHPSTKAFLDAILSLGSDDLIDDLLEHGIDCPICGERYREAKLKKKELDKKK